MDLQPIQDAARQGQLFFTDHVLRQMIKRAITEAVYQPDPAEWIDDRLRRP